MRPESHDLIEERTSWRKRHPLLAAREQGHEFTCYHTNKLTWEAVGQAIVRQSSIEIDVQEVGPELGQYEKRDYLSGHHPFSYLLWPQNPVPTQENSLRAEEVVSKAVESNLFVKFDCKLDTPESRNWVVRQAKRLKLENRMLHVFAHEIHAEQVPGIIEPNKQDEPYSWTELVKLKDLAVMKRKLDGIPIQVSCRGFTLSDLKQSEGYRYPLIDELCKRVSGIAEVINFNLKDGWEENENLRNDIFQYVWTEHKMMVEWNMDDKKMAAPQGIPFLGRSDHMEKTTVIGKLMD